MVAAITEVSAPEIKSDDRELVARAQSGDPEAFNEIFRQYRPWAQYVAMGILRNESDAQEIALSAMMNVHRSIVRFRGDSSLRTWIHRIAFNLATNRRGYWIRRRRGLTDSLSETYPDGTAVLQNALESDAPSPALEAEMSEFSCRIESAILRLRPKHRAILRMAMEGRTYDEMAETMNLLAGTVKSKLCRARMYLRREMQGRP